jgi:1,4-alpha-glucan branching enzyme
MGWMHDTLVFFSKDPIYRGHDLDQLTFAQVYEHTERFIMPLSHDEVVHGKGSLLQKMPGDRWQKFANLRLLLAYQYTRPGKVLLFMGTELAPDEEWSHERGLDWNLAADPPRAGVRRLIDDLGALYRAHPALWRSDPDPEGFEWIDFSDRDNAVVSYVRRWRDDVVVIVLNLTPVPRQGYRVGCPRPGTYAERLSTDRSCYGGSDYRSRPSVPSQRVAHHGRPDSLELDLPPLAALVLSPE